jgi:hypothetical protein
MIGKRVEGPELPQGGEEEGIFLQLDELDELGQKKSKFTQAMPDPPPKKQ